MKTRKIRTGPICAFVGLWTNKPDLGLYSDEWIQIGLYIRIAHLRATVYNILQTSAYFDRAWILYAIAPRNLCIDHDSFYVCSL